MGNSKDKGKSVPSGRSLPLPAPTPEDGGTQVGTRARVQNHVPRSTVRDMPALPPTQTGPRTMNDDRTFVDSALPEFSQRSEDTESPPEVQESSAAPRSLRTAKLPLPPPETERKIRRSPQLTGEKKRRGKRARVGSALETTTVVVSDPGAVLEGPLVGKRYRIVERVGQGGMGKVFKVTHVHLGKTFALKIISENFADEDRARDLFAREARLASSLSHPNIASVVDWGEDEERGAFMVMEYVDGEPLSRILRRESRFSLRLSCDVMLQVAEALHYIHSNKIVHCDIKTENILLCELPGTKRKKQVKLLDFGLARSTVAGRQSSSLQGTPHYVAPERIRGAQPTPASDIYGLGILFYELLTGKVPWDGSVAQILSGHLDQSPTRPSELIEGGLDPAVENLILRALAKSTRNRHKNMAAFIYELRTVMDMLGFGQRGRGRSRNRRVVIERAENKRDELARTVFDAARIPMALISKAGRIIVANAAFAKFVMGVAVNVEGLDVQATPLANAWETFERDLAKACGGESVRRILEIEVQQQMRRLLMWLDPGSSEDQALFGVHTLDS